MTNIKRKTINPENWVQDEVTYSVITLENKTTLLFDEEKYLITKEEMPDGTTIYALESLGITVFDWENIYEAVDECGFSRTAKDPIDAIVKVLANIL